MLPSCRAQRRGPVDSPRGGEPCPSAGSREHGEEGACNPAFLYVSSTPERRYRLQNASSNSLWVLERTHCTLGGRPLRRSGGTPPSEETPPPGPPTWRVAPSRRAAALGSSASMTSRVDPEVATEGGGAAGTGSDVTEPTDVPFDGVETPAMDAYAEAAEAQRRGMGAGEPVECVRIKHLATLRYLSVSEDYGSTDDDGDGGWWKRPRPRAGHRVDMIAVGRCAPIPSSTVFVVRPRPALKPGSSPGDADAADDGLGPEDLVHLQHRDTGFFLSALPHGDASGGAGKEWGRGSGGGRVGLTVIKSALTSEV